jgi:hypothetical protein
MRYLVTILLVLAFTFPAYAGEEKRIYPSGKPVLADFIAKQNPDGSYSIYKSDQVLIPLWDIKSDGRIYESGKPMFPMKDIKPWEKG